MGLKVVLVYSVTGLTRPAFMHAAIECAAGANPKIADGGDVTPIRALRESVNSPANARAVRFLEGEVALKCVPACAECKLKLFKTR